MEQQIIKLLQDVLAEQKKQNEKLDNLLNIFIKYDQDYNNEIIRDQGRSDLMS